MKLRRYLSIKDIEAWKRQVANYDADRGNDNGKSQKQQKQQNQKQEKDKKPKSKYPTFKYSARLRGKLHEAVLLNGEPVFLTYSSSNGLLKKLSR
jgi:hypothetical protein